jgi:hypothetical protein
MIWGLALNKLKAWSTRDWEGLALTCLLEFDVCGAAGPPTRTGVEGRGAILGFFCTGFCVDELPKDELEAGGAPCRGPAEELNLH